VGNLLCGFARNLAQLIVFRVIAGLGGGGIGVLVLIIISDISTLRTRGKADPSIYPANNST
jgi:MFS family permease